MEVEETGGHLPANHDVMRHGRAAEKPETASRGRGEGNTKGQSVFLLDLKAVAVPGYSPGVAGRAPRKSQPRMLRSLHPHPYISFCAHWPVLGVLGWAWAWGSGEGLLVCARMLQSLPVRFMCEVQTIHLINRGCLKRHSSSPEKLFILSHKLPEPTALEKLGLSFLFNDDYVTETLLQHCEAAVREDVAAGMGASLRCQRHGCPRTETSG